MKFLHTADLHLDSAFCLSSPTESERRRQRQRDVLKKIFTLAKAEDCDMILISGDLFDTVFVTPETRKLCLELFSDFARPIVISPGNHDPYVGGSFYKDEKMPENVYIFSSNELQFFDFYDLDVTVAGYAFTSSAMQESPLSVPMPVRHNGKVLLLCAHGDIDIPLSRYAPVMSSTLEKHGFDYAAFGHIHKYTEVKDNIVYCGFGEGRSFDEQGEGGVMIVSTDGVSPAKAVRHIVSEQCYITRELSLDGADTAEVVFDAFSRLISEYADKRGVNLRLELTGTVSDEAAGAIKELCDTSGTLASLDIVDLSLCLPDRAVLERDTTLRGEFYRSLLPSLYSDDINVRKTAIKALSIGLCAIDGKDFTAKESI